MSWDLLNPFLFWGEIIKQHSSPANLRTYLCAPLSLDPVRHPWNGNRFSGTGSSCCWYKWIIGSHSPWGGHLPLKEVAVLDQRTNLREVSSSCNNEQMCAYDHARVCLGTTAWLVIFVGCQFFFFFFFFGYFSWLTSKLSFTPYMYILYTFWLACLYKKNAGWYTIRVWKIAFMTRWHANFIHKSMGGWVGGCIYKDCISGQGGVSITEAH